MITHSCLVRACRWWSLPAGVLMILLQRSPALRMAATAGEYVLAKPAGSLLKGVFAAAASLGAVNSLAGATTLSSTSASPLAATVNTSVSVAFSVLGTTSSPESWTISGDVPPGLLLYATATGGTGVSTGTISASTLYLRGTPTTAGAYTLGLRANDEGGFMSPMFNYTVNVGGGADPGTAAPVITAHPVSLTSAPGGNVSFTVAATGSDLTYQWKRGGADVPGANGATLSLTGVQAAEGGDYTVVVSNGAGQATSRFARLVVGAPNPGRIVNMSVRSVAGLNGAPLIVGMVMEGGAKPVVIRAIGPGIVQFGVPNVLADPKMDLFTGQTVSDSNDNWGAVDAAGMSAAFAGVGAFALVDPASKDAALLATVGGARTVHVNSATTGNGVVLVEAYDAGAGNDVRLKNVSARNRVGTGADILIAGFVINGNTPKNVVIRGVGPRLNSLFGVTGQLADPRLEIYMRIGQESVLFATNDNWGDGGQAAAMNSAFSQVGAYAFEPGSKDAGLAITLPAGTFTAHVIGVGDTTGEAVVEVFEAP